MTPDWVFQVMWYSAGVGGTGALWYLLSKRKYHAAVWTGFATVVVVLLVVALDIQNDLILSSRNYFAEVWAVFAVVVVSLLAVALYINQNRLVRNQKVGDKSHLVSIQISLLRAISEHQVYGIPWDLIQKEARNNLLIDIRVFEYHINELIKRQYARKDGNVLFLTQDGIKCLNNIKSNKTSP